VPAVTVNVPVPEYAGVPPFPFTVIVVVPPLHKIVPVLAFAVSKVGSLTVIVVTDVQPFASVTV